LTEQRAPEARPDAKNKLKRVLVLTLRYVIPSLATVTGLLAWWVSSVGNTTDSAEKILPPADEFPPIAIQMEIPVIPIEDVRLGLYPPQGDANCLVDSSKSARALACEVKGEVLDPCYWIPGGSEITETYCFDPVTYKYTAYTVTDILDIWALKDQGMLWESTAVATFLFVKAPDYAFEEYGESLVDGMEVCVLTNFEPQEGQVQSYECKSGATILSDVFGDRPHLFVTHSSPSGDRISSQWIKYIIYG